MAQLFANESGGHRWQREPENEKRGRVHTSTITVAVLDEPTDTQVHLDMNDVDVRTCRGSGAGGQHRNRTESAVQLVHRPSGITVRCENERSQHQNRAEAIQVLRARLLRHQKEIARTSREQDRRFQVGTGMRGDKAFTIAVQRDTVVSHRTGKTTTYQRYRKGYIEDLE